MKRLKRYAKYALVALFVVYLGAVGYDITKTPENASEQPKQAVAAPVVEQQPPTVEELLRLVNEERAKVGVKPLKLNKAKMVTAQWKADDMYKNNYFSHYPPVIDGKPNTQKVTLNHEMAELTRKACVESSENIVAHNTSSGAISWWLNSKPHREAMQDSKYESTGIGIRYVKRIPGSKVESSKPFSGDLKESYLIVQHFCDEQ